MFGAVAGHAHINHISMVWNEEEKLYTASTPNKKGGLTLVKHWNYRESCFRKGYPKARILRDND